MNMNHMNFILAVALEDVRFVREREATYQGSWKRRGGVGAFMMLARKWDRIEPMVSQTRPTAGSFDIFAHIEANPSGEDGTVLAEVRDLRRYLLLVEAEMIARAVVPGPEVSQKDLYDILASYWGTTREVAKHRALGMAYGKEAQGPGTPEDGGHHARLEDGETERPPWAHISGGVTETFHNVDRTKFAPGDTDHLPRLQIEMNNHEWNLQRPWYQWMYTWHDDQSKHILRPEYRELWGAEA